MTTTLDLLLLFHQAILGAILVAVVCGVLGVFVVLRGFSMMGDGLAHISFAGVALGLAVGFYPFGLALVFAVIGAIAIHYLRSREIVKGDTAIGIMFTAGLALGVILVSLKGGFNVDLHAYLFGSLLMIGPTDLWFVAAVAGVLLVLFTVLFKEFFYLTFSEEAARVSGLPVGVLNVVFVSVTAATIVVAARIVGILLVSALLVVPAATSLQVAKSFRGVIVASVLFGVAGVLLGVYASAEWALAPGGAIALGSTLLFAGVVAGKAIMGRLRGSAA